MRTFVLTAEFFSNRNFFFKKTLIMQTIIYKRIKNPRKTIYIPGMPNRIPRSFFFDRTKKKKVISSLVRIRNTVCVLKYNSGEWTFFLFLDFAYKNYTFPLDSTQFDISINAISSANKIFVCRIYFFIRRLQILYVRVKPNSNKIEMFDSWKLPLNNATVCTDEFFYRVMSKV